MKTIFDIGKTLAIIGIVWSVNTKAQQTASVSANGYSYRNAVGFRAGLTSGLTYKHIFNGGNAFEGIVSSWPYSLGLTGLYEKNIATDVAGLKCYLGAGGHYNMGGAVQRAYYFNYYTGRGYDYVYVKGGRAIGIDGIMGVEYKFRPLPLSISADIKPFAEISNYGNVFIALDPSLGIKLAF